PPCRRYNSHYSNYSICRQGRCKTTKGRRASIQHHRMLARLPFVITKYWLPARITIITATAATTMATTATTITTIVTIPTTTTTRTTARCVCQSAAGIKLLFASSKCKVLTTVTTGEDTVLVSFIGHHG